jgi:glyoxylase-like metal-dependent hydrolase (beta-lactamase superfamily II)
VNNQGSAFVSPAKQGQSAVMAAGESLIRSSFDEATQTVSYLIADPVSKAAAIIDPVLDFNSADRVIEVAAADGLTVEWVLETHPHADHLSAAAYVKRKTGARTAIGSGVREVQKVFAPRFGADDVKPDGSGFDRLLEDGDVLHLGELEIHIMATPGHTRACIGYRVGDAMFTGDTLFMPDYGTARTDFPGGDARMLYRSIQRILALPRETRLFLCHDYKAPGRDHYAWETTVGEELDRNVHIHAGVTEDEFVAMREARDATLSAPHLLYPAIQVNIRGGRFPPPDDEGRRFLKLPLTLPKDVA